VHSLQKIRTPIISPALQCEHPAELFEPPDLWLPSVTDGDEEEQEEEEEEKDRRDLLERLFEQRAHASQEEDEPPVQKTKSLIGRLFQRRHHREWWNALYRKEVAAEVAWSVIALPGALPGALARRLVIAKHVALQQMAFLAFVLLSANDNIIKARSKRHLDGPNAGRDFPYAFSSVLLVSSLISVLAGSAAAWTYGGWPVLCRCWRPRSLLKLSPISALFQFATVLKFMSLKYLSPDVVSMLSQMNLVMLAVAMRFVLGKRYRNSQCIALALTSLAMLQYVTVRDAHAKGGLNESPVQLSGDVLEGVVIIAAMSGAETLASVFAEKYFKERQEAFYVQKVHVEVTGLIFAALWCYVLEPFCLKDLNWSCRPQRCRQVIDEGLLSGWDNATLLVLLMVVSKSWLAGLVARVLDSVVKQLGSCSATTLTYLEVVWLNPKTEAIDFTTVVALSVVMMSIASFAVSTREALTIERLKAEIAGKDEAELLTLDRLRSVGKADLLYRSDSRTLASLRSRHSCDSDASWTQSYQMPSRGG